MRALRYLLLAVLLIVLLVLALANRGMVELDLLPDEMAAFVGTDPGIRLPLFLAVLGGIAVGLLIGFVREWLREHRHRAEAARERRRAAKLERELERYRKREPGGGDDVLALVEDERRSG